MGIFIISPFDKGGKLFDPTPTPFSESVAKASAGLDGGALNAMHYAALWLWRRPGIHTISVGARSPTDFDNHVAASQLLPVAVGGGDGAGEGGDADVGGEMLEARLAPLLDPIDSAVAELQTTAGLDDDWLSSWWHGLPNALDPDADGANLPHLLFIYNVLVSHGIVSKHNISHRASRYFV